ncbi:MAG: endonuclease/exonuclease/phosphatase family protein, partial [Nocardioidaceae bacterium]
MKLRVLTYNILGGKAAVALRSVVRSVDPDVMLVNESPHIPLVWRWRCPTLARQWELQHIAGGRNAGRNMICAQYHVGVSHTRVQRFSQPRFRPIRGLVWAQLQIDSHPFGLVGCHLSLDSTRRLREVERVLEAAARLE